ncbi:hypothetical protein DS745_07425 [Anaerobacillus alkaliphilus]|uniref:ParB/Sulfiredoxin domain-containing protein n=1 Tax=Anaerobacillus alkaliphilus TaxID=1548597 RepID=A0A4Q0VU50_9BACI|nr:hypothetical protein [Anaerobacillus alkaliphilus]RXJ02211.1 hypothetical protein DS745_07425 [Anaerobacillus alkaliphilus]
MRHKRQIKLNEEYTPLPSYEGDEFFPNGIFNFNISRITEHIHDGTLKVEKETIDVGSWFETHYHASVNEEHLPTVDVNKPVIQAEVQPGEFNIIDGNHRMEKAYRDGVTNIQSYKLRGEQLLPYFMKKQGYTAFVEYWNSKLKEDERNKKLKENMLSYRE